MKHRALGLMLGLMLAQATCLAAAQEGDEEAGEWHFTAMLDGKPIGTHRFVVGGTAATRSVDSRALFTVRVLGIPVYRYRHQAEERWAGDCLRALRAETDDDGTRQQIAQRFDGDCPMSFAYWNPRLVKQQRLIDPQTGKVEPVRFEPLPDATLEVRGRPVRARGWRLQAAQQRIRIWYAADSGRWIGLDADTKGDRQLSYRLTSPARSTP
ncbi:hypothetical protein J2W24_003122 [Variovorax boronicumulans]|uniref:DUF6134 family protein n=1 Tax=Variovorax boronicumulans TaxID=436515 RepID=UPI002789286D|nr:DUF6134 family protein [Variovorax boronicumulans]MDP9917471.1 hypothetical protein [Variovorax boronicumulans]